MADDKQSKIKQALDLIAGLVGNDDAKPAPKPEKAFPTYEPTGTYDFRTGKAYRPNSRGQLVEDHSGGSALARGADFDPHDVS